MNAHVPIARSGSTVDAAATKYRLRVADYVLLHEQGSFGEQKTELVDGDVYLMGPEWRPHLRVKSELAYRLRRAVEDAGLPYFVGIEGSVALSDTDMPQPDILLTSAIEGDGPIPRESVPLVVEISSTTLNDDIGSKADRYAVAGIAAYWVVDLNERVIYQMWAPSDGAYAERHQRRFGTPIRAATLHAVTIETDGL